MDVLKMVEWSFPIIVMQQPSHAEPFRMVVGGYISKSDLM